WLKLDTIFKSKIKTYKGPVEDFIKTFNTDVHHIGRIYFHLVESKKEDLPFAFLATYSTGINDFGKSKHIALKHALTEFGKNSKKLLELLSAVNLAAKESKVVAGLIESGEIFYPIALSAKDAYDFLKEVPIYEKCGILCRIPNWWKNKASSIKLEVSIGNTSPSFLGKDSILDFKTNLLFGGSKISEDEARKLLNESAGLAFIKGKWVEADPEKLKLTLQAYEKAQQLMKQGNLSLKDAMYLQLNLQKGLGVTNDDTVSISNGEWLKSVVDKLHKPELIDSVNPANNFLAELRPYQQKGLNWLYFLHSLQFGACLADDMGLGKTIQLLAFLNILKANKKKQASLLILPASLISNWVNEISRFSPEMKYYIAHPSFDKNSGDILVDNNFTDKYDLVMTTYSLSKKYEWL
ncbi:MAG: SNF2 helicase-associated domain-containing protein, partial [Candidatus Methanoperedens sp.]|nr:SNF2 helicase-associated domain-containing protein [Candidatus Methanoperedens sp.]